MPLLVESESPRRKDERVRKQKKPKREPIHFRHTENTSYTQRERKEKNPPQKRPKKQ